MPHDCRYLSYLCLTVLAVLTSILLVRTFTLEHRTDDVKMCMRSDADFISLTDERLQRFRQALRFRTVSRDVNDCNREQLTKFGEFIVKSFPALHSSSSVEHEFVANHSLLYSIQGSECSLTPYLLSSHLDVVPADDANLWEAPPFSGDVKDNFIYGRGSIDVKQGVMGILEALEHLFANDFQPQRSFYVAFGHDEEVTGREGAYNVARILKSRGVEKLEFVSDEGLTVTQGIVPGISKPVALIGTSEKGQAILRLSVKGQTGHSSMPMKDNVISVLAKAIHKLETNPHPSMFGYGPEKSMFEHLAPEMHFGHRLIMANLWLFGPFVNWLLAQKPTTNAVIRTVTSITKFNSGIKDNVIPPEAVAIVNHRIHPAQTVKEVIDHDRYIISDKRVKIEVKSSMEPHPMSPHGDTDFGYQVMKNSIRQVWTKAVVAPGVMIGNTDSRHYLQFTHNVYRFSPTYMLPSDLRRFHGTNERISMQNYEQAINFYQHLILNADKDRLRPLHTHGGEL